MEMIRGIAVLVIVWLIAANSMAAMMAIIMDSLRLSVKFSIVNFFTVTFIFCLIP
ncbi:hypothetical protein D3C80_1709010 [compost metagenome]